MLTRIIIIDSQKEYGQVLENTNSNARPNNYIQSDHKAAILICNYVICMHGLFDSDCSLENFR